MTAPRLTDIFRNKADSALTKEISSEIWEGIGRELGFSEEDIRDTLPQATRGAADPAEKRGGTLSAVFGTCAAVLAITAAVMLCGPFAQYTSGPPVTIVDQTIPSAGFPTAGIECRDEVHYKAGAVVTRETFAEDAQIHAHLEDGAVTDYKVLGFEDIDFTKPGEYFVQVEMGSREGKIARVITVIVE